MASLELLIDRLLSASTPTDCLDSLEQLQSQCKYNKPKSNTSTTNTSNDPKKSRPSQKGQQDNEASAALKLAEENELQRQSTAIDTVISNKLVLNVLCSLVATSTLPSQHDANGSDGMEVEGGDIAACELLLALLPSRSPTQTANSKKNGSAVTTEGLQKQRNQKKRMEFISKTLLHFHESTDDNNELDTNKDKLALVPSLLDCLCASTQSTTTNQPSVYARVLTLQILSSLLVASPGTLREQLMMAPDGINRLVDLLGHSSMSVDQSGSNSEVPEEVRNESILFLTSLASSSSMLARLITFSEGYDRALKIATIESTSSSFSIGSTTVMDCLQLCLSLAQADEVSRELFIGGGDDIGNLNRLCKLIDLRVGERFKDKERNVWWDNKLKDEQLSKKKKSESSASNVVNEEKKQQSKEQGSTSRKGKRGKKSKQDDDLDDILKGATSTTSSTPAIPPKTTNIKKETQPNKPTTEPEGPPTPYLTPNETQIVNSVFKLILILLQDGDDDSSSTTTKRSSITDASRTKRRTRAKTIISHDLTRYIVDCALYTLPPLGVDYVSAVPPSKLQLLALVVMSVLGSLGGTVLSEEEVAKKKSKSDTTTDKSDDTAATDLRKKQTDEESKLQTQLLFETMPIYLHGKVTAIDRLMYLCCTGGYAPNSSVDDYESSPEEVASLLSTYSVSTFRSCLPSETASRMVLHALAPPLPDETDEMGAPLQPPVVSRLVTTMADNLQFLQSQQTSVEEEEKEVDMSDINRATISAAGSAGALGVFLTCGEGDATREMLLRLSPPPPPRPKEGDDNNTFTTESSSSANLIDFILQHIATYDPASSSNALDTFSAYIAMSLLRLLSEWVIGMPRAVTEVLSSPSSVSMGVLVRSKKGNSPAAEVVPAMSGLLLGLCLEYMEDSSTSAGDVSTDVENAAWTRDTVMNMIQSIGVGKYLSMLDEWKKRPLPLPYCSGEERSSLERQAFANWYGDNVTLVRRRVVVALAGSKGDDDSDESDAEATDDKPSLRSLRKMVSSQAQENEELQSKLDEALSTIASQSTQIEGLKRVTEAVSSADTNDMISEYIEKITELEQAKAEMKKEAENQTKLQDEAIASKDSDIIVARKELEESQARVEELRRDNETMSEEMAGLSSAYNSLEEQYHRSNSSDNIPTTSTTTSTEMTAGGEAAAEDGGARSGEPAAEDPSRNNHHEIQSLREDNARLREEGRAANEWMSMAVSKMEEMSTENAELTTSLEGARTTLATAESNTTPNESVSAIQSELDALRLETQRFREESEVKLKAKDDEYAQQQVRVQQLEQQVEEMKQSSSENTIDPSSPTSQEVEELKQVMNRQEEELTSLRQANKDAQEWMANAVTHVDQLTKDVQEKDQQIEQMAKSQSQTSTQDDTSNVSPAIIVGLEKNLSSVTSERDELKLQLETVTNEVSDLLASNEDLKKKLDDDSQVQDFSEQENALRIELDKVKAENTLLTTNLSEFQTWSTTAQERMAELESNIQEIIADRDELKSQVETITAERDELKSQPEPTMTVAPESNELPSDVTNQQVESLQSEIRFLNEQLERMQDQLIEDADENEAKVDKLMEDLHAEKQRVADMKVEEQSLAATIESLTSEKDKLTSALSEAQADKLNGNQGDSSVDDRIIAITAERNELQSQLNGTNEEYKEAQSSLERLGVENGNLTARIRALEQDNKSLEYQFSELEGKITIANDEKAVVESSLEDLKMSNEENVRLLQERTQTLESQIETQEKEATEAIAQWEVRCSSLEGSGESVIKQWEEKVESLEADINTLQSQLKQQELDAAEAITQWEARCSSLEDSGGDVIRQWEERVQALESDITALESQLEQQEKEASEAITQWESRCSALEDSGGDVIQQWEERVKTLESDITMLQDQLEQQEKQAAEAITQWEARCLSVEEDGGAVIQQWEERVHALESDITTLREQTQQQSNTIENLQLQIKEKDVEIFNSDEQVSELSKELLDAGYQSEVVVKQWQERCEQLQASINEYEEAMEEIKTGSEETVQLWQERTQELETQIETQEKEATEAITQWEARCTTLNEQVENLEQQVLANENDTVIPELKDEVASLTSQLQASKSDGEKIQEQLNDAKASLAQRMSEWEEKETTLTSTIEQLNNKYSEQQKEFSEGMASVNSLKERCSTLQEQNTTLQEQYTNALKESEESQVVVIELQEELRIVKEELQAFATDQFTAKATEMATEALREQMDEIRSQYTVDQQALASESEARRVAEEEVDRLKSDLALLAQATEYNDDVDVHIRRIAKKMTADNIKTERKEIDELRSTLERLREELGSCRWKERESEEKAANARLQMSILEQEVIAAKTDLAMCQQAMEDVETSKIDASVSLEYRVEALENERRLAEQSYEEEIYNIKEELAQNNQDRDEMAHKLQQSEKANAALVYSTTKQHESLGSEDNESEVIKLQLERAQLLAKINEMGVDLERRVREAVAAQSSKAEAERIIENQSRKSVESSLADALQELKETKKKLLECSSDSKDSELADKVQTVQDLEESLDDIRLTNEELQIEVKTLRAKFDTTIKENESTIDELKAKLQNAEERLRVEERERRFETALAAEIVNLKRDNGTNQKTILKLLVLRGIDLNMQPSEEGKEANNTFDRNSAYIIEMYDYVVELKTSITDERQMYKELLTEHEDLLALLGQTGTQWLVI